MINLRLESKFYYCLSSQPLSIGIHPTLMDLKGTAGKCGRDVRKHNHCWFSEKSKTEQMNLEADICNNWNNYKKMSLVLVVGSSEEEKITIVQLWEGQKWPYLSRPVGWLAKFPKKVFFCIYLYLLKVVLAIKSRPTDEPWGKVLYLKNYLGNKIKIKCFRY